MLKNSSYSSRISYEALRDGEGGLEKSLASSRLSFEPSRWSTLTGSASVSNLADNAIAEFDAWRVGHMSCLPSCSSAAAAGAGRPPAPNRPSPAPCLLQEHHPCALEHFDRFAAEAAGKLVAVFLDYDGELPAGGAAEDAGCVMLQHMRASLWQPKETLQRRHGFSLAAVFSGCARCRPCRHVDAHCFQPRRCLHD